MTITNKMRQRGIGVLFSAAVCAPFEGKADIACALQCPLMTQSGHRLSGGLLVLDRSNYTRNSRQRAARNGDIQ